MPTLYSRLTTAQLSITDFTEATTAHPLQHQCKDARANIQHASKALVYGSRDRTLTEDPIYTQNSQSHIHFLGEYEDIPFFMVHAGKDYFDPHTSKGGRTRRPARSPLTSANANSAPNQLPTRTRTTSSNFEVSLGVQSEKEGY